MKHSPEHNLPRRTITKSVLTAIGVGAVAGAAFLGISRDTDKSPSPTNTTQTTTDGCESPKDFRKIAGIGDMACKLTTGPNEGLYKVRFEDGSTFLTHGGDPAPTTVEPTPHP